MIRRLGRLTLVAATALSLAACAAPRRLQLELSAACVGRRRRRTMPGMSHAPAEPAAATGARSRSRRSTSASSPRRSRSRPPGTYEVTFKNTGVAPHDVTFADGTKIAANGGETATGTVDRPGRRPDLHLLDPGPRGRPG